MKEMQKVLRSAMCLTLVTTSLQLTPFMTTVHAVENEDNLAYGKTTSASNYTEGHEPSKANDGDKATSWAADTTGILPWYLVDLGTQMDFDEVYMKLENDDTQKIAKFKIEASNDGSNYDIIYEGDTKKKGYDLNQTITLDKTVRYQYVKVTIEQFADPENNHIAMNEFGILATDDGTTPVNVNLALNKPVTASKAYSTMPASNLTDSDLDSRWSTESAATQWAYVDLGAEQEMNKFQMIWESESVYASEYNIYVSNDKDNWGTPVVAKKDSQGKISTNLIAKTVKGRYVKLEVTKTYGYPSVSARDFQIMLADETAQDPYENVALGKTAVAHDSETADFNASKLVDGDTTSRSSRWAATQEPTWAYVDLGGTLNVNTLKLFWERRNTNDYEIQIANTLQDPMQESDWETVKAFTSYPDSKDQKIVLDKTYNARYVRVKINKFDAKDQDNIDNWKSVSLYEMQVFGGNPKASITDIVNAIKVDNPAKGDKILDISDLPKYDDFDITYNGSDYEQIIDEDLTIFEPLVDTKVKVSFKVTDKETGTYKFKETEVIVPGTHVQDAVDNVKPTVLPELREWKGSTDNFLMQESTRLVVGDAALLDTAKTFAADYKEITGKDLAVVEGEAAAGDIYFTLTDDKTKGLKDEGYIMDISDHITVEAETSTGAYWSTRTLLQILKGTNYESVPRGTTRDYPLYKVRGFILDVARKPFTMDFIEQITKEMSYYKLNDFQIHLNDNYIFLEEYTAMGQDPMQAYSAFRLESDIKKGGNGGLNKQDLTSTDTFYTKDEFRSYIKAARARGVNIVPEIDTPAHSLALTKVRPDLRVGTSGRNNDHLNLTDKYDDSTAFVKSIFDEYLTDENPVFDEDTIVHVGADEYNASSTAYRRFSNAMIKYVKDKDRTPRIWGSLTAAAEGEEVRGEGTQINLWNFGYANMDKMYDLGFDLINCNDGQYYIVPNAGYYGDYLNKNNMYNLNINTISGVTIPAGDKQMIGGAFAVWNDMIDRKNNGISEYDVFDRIRSGLPLIAANLWGKGNKDLNTASSTADALGDAPGTNFAYDVATKTNNIAQYTMDDMNDTSGNEYNLSEGKNGSIELIDYKNALKLNGAESYINTGLTTVGLGNDLRVKVKRTSASTDEQILFESAYGSIKAVQKNTGKVGFSREMYDYSFNYTLPVNEWVELEIKNTLNKAYLYVNGVLTDTLGDGEQILGRPLVATTMFPMERIGSKTNAFIGYVDDVRLAKSADYASTMALDHAVWTANAVMANQPNEALQDLVDQADAIFNSYQPDAAAITALTDQINAILADTEYEKADYSRIDTYEKLISGDLSAFTTESVAVLRNVAASVRKDLPKEMQNLVDGYEESIVNALNGLVLKTDKNINYVDSSKMKATASSYQQDGSDPKNVLDGDPTTFWHTAWNLTVMPHWIDLTFDEPTKINSLSYLPRQSGTNGNITSYKIQVSDDGTTYTDIKTGTWANNAAEKVVEFDAVTTKHIRLVAVAGIGNFANAAEIKIARAEVPADITGLQSIMDSANAIENTGYTSTSWDNLQAILAEAAALVGAEKPDPNDVEIMKRNLSDAIMKLRLSEATVNKDALKAAMAEAQALLNKENLYTDAYILALRASFDEANAVFISPTATQAEVALVTAKLKTLIQNPILKEDTAFMKGILNNAITKAINAVASPEYEKLAPAVKEAITNALSEAEAVYAKGDATNTDIMTAWNNLASSLHYLDFKADKTALLALIAECDAITTDDYQNGVQEFKDALKNAHSVADDETALQPRIDTAHATLLAAKLGLGKDTVNKEFLNQLITFTQTAKDNASKYNQDSNWTAFLTAFDEAVAVNVNANATQSEVSAAGAKLAAAYENIRLIPDESLIQTLKDFVKAARALNANDYPAAVYADILKTADDADAMITNSNYPLGLLNTLLENIDKAYGMIENGKVDVPQNPSVTPNGNTQTPSDKDQTIKPEGTTKPGTTKTGDTNNAAGLLALLSGAGITAFFAKKKNKKNKK